MKDNLHRDFEPTLVIDSIKSKTIRGAILLLRFKKVSNLTFFQKILTFFMIYLSKDIYFWLPYKGVVDGSNKYSVIGPAKRHPYSNCWFEIKETNEIYKRGLTDFVYKQRELCKNSAEYCLAQPFLKDSLIIVTRKRVIRVLDSFLFKQNINNKKQS